MGMDTVKRFDRIVAILIQLQSKRIVKAQELSDRFEVSLRTIYRDIRTLEAAGVPIAGEAVAPGDVYQRRGREFRSRRKIDAALYRSIVRRPS